MQGNGSTPAVPALVLAYKTLMDPRDLAEVLHLAAGFGARVHLVGKSLDPGHWKVLRKLKSWRPSLANEPERIEVELFDHVLAWAESVRSQNFMIAATVLEGGVRPWSDCKPNRFAVLFGEETHGLKPGEISLCDERWTLPLGTDGRFYTVGQATALVLGGWQA